MLSRKLPRRPKEAMMLPFSETHPSLTVEKELIKTLNSVSIK
jgi:hypothetical protein